MSGTYHAANLFGIDSTKKKPAKASPPAPAHAIQSLIGIYRQAFEKKFGEPPVVLKSDGAILKGLVTTYGSLKVEQRLRAFMAWEDEFVVNSGFSLRMLHTRWNALAARCAQEQPQQTKGVMSTEETDAYLRRLRASSR